MTSGKRPLGQQVHAVLVGEGQGAARLHADQLGQPDIFERVQAVALEEPTPSFLHSALCAMSLPVRKPADDKASIIRQDGQYTLAITPRPVLQRIDGQQRMAVLGVPYGSLPRLVLIHIMTEAVRTRSRHIVLGTSFTDWMRRMGFRTISYGPRGSATLIREQLDRLLACEWMIRWDSEIADGNREFAVKEVKLTNDYAGRDDRRGTFSPRDHADRGFFRTIFAIMLSRSTRMQSGSYAIARPRSIFIPGLPTASPASAKLAPSLLSWSQLAVHFGNDGNNIRKFRQTIRDAWERHVSAVYPEARAEFDTTAIRLFASPAPLQRRALRLVAPAAPPPPALPAQPVVMPGVLDVFKDAIGDTLARAWLSDASFESTDDGASLVVGSRFKADYIRQNFGPQLDRAARECGLPRAPAITSRGRAAR